MCKGFKYLRAGPQEKNIFDENKTKQRNLNKNTKKSHYDGWTKTPMEIEKYKEKQQKTKRPFLLQKSLES